ncbi:MAG: VWA domain-containing protein [Phycisphaerales bacterium]
MTPADFAFANPSAATWTWAVLAIAVLAAIRLRGRIRALRTFAEDPLLRAIAPRAGVARPAWRTALSVMGLAALVPALMDPRWGAEVEEVRRRGADVFFLVDVSRSMTAEDAAPNRLQRARELVDETVESLGGDRVGLVEFAGTAAMRVPLTLNYGAFRTSLSELKPLSGARGGTALAKAIALAAASFPETSAGSRAIVILSDGEDLGGDGPGNDPVAAAKEVLGAHGIHTYTIGIGDAREGARIPVARTAEGVRYLVHEGQEVWSRMDEGVLRDTALAGEGAYIPAGTERVDMARAYAQTVGLLERQESDASTVTRRTPRFQWFAGVAFACLLGATLVPAPRVRREVMT